MRFKTLFTLAAIVCGTVAATEAKPLVTVNESFFTSRDHAENTDSPAAWHGPNGEHWLFSSAKSTNSVLLEDATNGAFIRRLGGHGSELGQFDRPNGVWVEDDLLFVVERDNRRVQVIALPELTAVGAFGSDILTNPYGLYVRKIEPTIYQVFVTDNYETEDEETPPASELGRRVAIFGAEIEGRTEGTMDAEHLGYIGETSGEGALRIVESIYGDPENGTLLIAEEDNEHATSGVKVYDFEGEFQGKILVKGNVRGQAEGIALVPGPDGSGYWICTDQGMKQNTYHVFDRKSLKPIGSFQGSYTLNTDGVWFSPEPVLPRYPEGIFYAVHNDGNVAAFNWQEVKQALGLE